MSAPAEARPMAISAPRPREPPVMRAVFPVRLKRSILVFDIAAPMGWH